MLYLSSLVSEQDAILTQTFIHSRTPISLVFPGTTRVIRSPASAVKRSNISMVRSFPAVIHINKSTAAAMGVGGLLMINSTINSRLSGAMALTISRSMVSASASA